MSQNEEGKSEVAQRYERGIEIRTEIDQAIYDKLWKIGDILSSLEKPQEAYIRRKVIKQIADEDGAFPDDLRDDCKLVEAIDDIRRSCGNEAKDFLLSDAAKVDPKQIVRLARLDREKQKTELATMQRNAGYVSNAPTRTCDDDDAVEESRDDAEED